MNYKYFLAVFILILLTISIYYLSPDWSRNISSENNTYLVYPICDSNDIALSLNKSNETICLSNNNIYLFRNQIKYDLYEIGEEEILISSTPMSIVTQFEGVINYIQLNSKSEVVNTRSITLHPGETISSIFYKNMNTYISTIMMAETEDDNKTRIIIIEQDEGYSNSISYISTKRMYSIIDVIYKDDGEILLLSEPYSFLEPYKDAYSFSMNKIIKYPEETQQDFESLSDINKLSLDSEVEFTYPNLQDLNLIGKINTQNGKKVYNCNDFRESDQITLRACIAQNEKTDKEITISK